MRTLTKLNENVNGNPVLANYINRFIFMCASTDIYVKESNEVYMYEIARDAWSECPSRNFMRANHTSLCLGRMLYVFFGSDCLIPGVKTPMKSIERLDVQAHIEGRSV